MNDLTISIFGSKIFYEILNELNLFKKFKIKYYQDLAIYLKNDEKENVLVVFLNSKKELILFEKNKISNFPLLLISNFLIPKNIFSNDLTEKLVMPFSILEFEKKTISLFAKNKFRKNSLIKLGNYIIDKNERKISKENLELQLSEKEINFLILFASNKQPIERNLVLKNVWNYSSETETHTVETHIHRLRKKILQKFNDKNFIKNNNKGYFI